MSRILAVVFAGACAALAGCAEMVADPNKQQEIADTSERRQEQAVPVMPVTTQQPAATFQGHHESCAELFAKSMAFGRGRMPVRRQHGQPDYPRSLHLSAVTADPDSGVAAHEAATWTMKRIELVGMLVNDKPIVYPAENPRKGGSTRALDDFETRSLAALRNGEQVQIQRAPAEVRMLGAIRTRADCKRCHDQPDGTLLGAFSYVFVPGEAQPKAPGQAP